MGLGCEDADPDTRLSCGQLALEFTKGKGNKVGRHSNGFVEVVDTVFLVILRHVGNDRFARVFIEFDRQAEGRFSSGLIDGREGLASGGSFELCSDNLLLFAVYFVVGWVDSHHGIGQRGRVVDA